MHFVSKWSLSLDGGKVPSSKQFARNILLILGYSTASSAQGDRDSGEYKVCTDHISNKSG